MKHIILPRKSKPLSLGRDKSRSDLDCVAGIMLDTVKDTETKGRVPPSSSLGCQGEKQVRGGYIAFKGGINCSWRGWRGIGVREEGLICSWDGTTGWRNKWNGIDRGTEVGNRGSWWWHCSQMVPREGVGWQGGEALLEHICEEGKGR